eukprot:9785250-Heterocapsa_arctica.AAC.1
MASIYTRFGTKEVAPDAATTEAAAFAATAAVATEILEDAADAATKVLEDSTEALAREALARAATVATE